MASTKKCVNPFMIQIIEFKKWHVYNGFKFI